MAEIKQPDLEVLTYIRANYHCVQGKLFNSHGKEVCFALKHVSSKSISYSYLQIGNRRYKRSHVVWFLTYGFWPKLDLLHKDGDRLNDNIENLEEHTVSERHSRRAGSRMYKGFSVYVEKNKKTNPWRVKNYKYSIELGYFATREEAISKIDRYLDNGEQWWI